MLINTNTAFAIRCDICGRLKLHDISLFDICKTGEIEFKCLCGQPNAIIKTKNYKSFIMEIPCFACQDTHVFKYSLKQLVKGNIVTRCIETGMEISFIGNNEDINQLMDKYERDSKNILNELGFYDYFHNFDIAMQCLTKVKELSDRRMVNCDCGNSNIDVELFPDRIELKCNQCESVQIIYAENEEDLKNIIKRQNITMQKHSFVCIDAINQNRDSGK